MSTLAPTVAQRRPPQTRVRWTTSWIALVLLAALLPPFAAVAMTRGTSWLVLTALSVATALLWNLLFAFGRRRALGIHWIVAPLLVSILLPVDLPLWQAALAVSFGTVSGEMIFGGRNWSFLNSAAVSLGFLLFSFPATLLAEPDWLVAAAVAPAAAILLLSSVISWRVPAGAAIACGVGTLLGGADPLVVLTSGSFVFGAVFLAADPVASPATNPGRLAHGLLFGALVALFASADAGPLPHAVIFASLLSSVLAPLVDQFAIVFNVMRRRRRYGRL